MNDYFLQILIRQRHAEIMAACRATRFPRLERPRRASRMNPILRSFIPGWKTPLVNRAPTEEESRMKWAEVIMVRSAVSSAEILDATVQDLMNAVAIEVEHKAMRVFRHEKLDSDICIVLFHGGKKTNAGGSPLGLHLVAALKEVGLVNHTIWSEIER